MTRMNGRSPDVTQDEADHGEIMNFGIDAMVSELTHEQAIDELDKPKE